MSYHPELQSRTRDIISRRNISEELKNVSAMVNGQFPNALYIISGIRK